MPDECGFAPHHTLQRVVDWLDHPLQVGMAKRRFEREFFLGLDQTAGIENGGVGKVFLLRLASLFSRRFSARRHRTSNLYPSHIPICSYPGLDLPKVIARRASTSAMGGKRTRTAPNSLVWIFRSSSSCHSARLWRSRLWCGQARRDVFDRD